MAIDIEAERVVERASFREMRTVDINDVIEYVHAGIQQWPTSRDLYDKYAIQRWNVQELDFTQDRIDWETKLSNDEKEAFLYVATGFHHGERQVEVDLWPEFMAIDNDEDKIFLTSQMEDEARHTIFFDRFYREVVGYDGEGIRGVLHQSYAHATPGLVGAFAYLTHLGDRIRQNPEDKHTLVEFIAAYHLWIEGVGALTVMQTTLNFCRRRGVLPGYYQGFNATTRDESRHVQFGTSVLHRLLHEDPTYVEDINRALRVNLAISSVAAFRVQYEPLGYTEEEFQGIFMNQLTRKTRAIGLELPQDILEAAQNVRPEAFGGG